MMVGFVSFIGEVRVAQILIFCVVFGRLLFFSLFLFLWSLYCLSFDLRLLITLSYLQTFLPSGVLMIFMICYISLLYVFHSEDC